MCEEFNARINSRTTCHSHQLTHEGQIANHGEFPHMAAIGWRSKDGSISFKCGGSLISDRFVLTSGHCSQDNGERPHVVRLGAKNLKKTEHNNNSIDVLVHEVILHANFTFSYYHDIALIRLKESVVFSDFVRPACLGVGLLKGNISNLQLIESGWAHTEDNEDVDGEILKVGLDFINTTDCNNHLKQYKLPNGITERQMCAGVLTGRVNLCSRGKLFRNLMKFNYQTLKFPARFRRTHSIEKFRRFVHVSRGWHFLVGQLDFVRPIR